MQKKTTKHILAAAAMLAAAGAAIAADRVNERRINVGGAQVTLRTSERDAGAVSYSISLPNGGTTTVEKADYTLGIPLVSGDPLFRDPAGPAELMTGGDGVYIVQFHTQPIEAYTRGIEAAGGRIYQYAAQYAYIVQLDAGALATVSALPYVRWVGEYQPAYKLDGDLLLRDHGVDLGAARPNMTGFNLAREAGDAATPVTISVFENGMGMKGAVVQAIQAMGGEVTDAGAEGYLLGANLTGAQIAAIARMGEVQAINASGPWGMDMDNGRIVTGANYVTGQTAPPNPANGYQGDGVRAEICDSETLVTHSEFASNVPIVHRAGNSGLHGTACTSVNFADGIQPAARGFLPNGQGIFANSSGLLGGAAARYTHTAELLNAPYFAVWQTNSTGDPQITTYSTISQQMDDILFINEVLHFQSQSNTGNQNSRPQAWAKNMVSVGGINHFNDANPANDSWGGASVGYGADGRAKPDLANHYDATRAAWGSGVSSYTDFSGTSNATPMSAGVTGLFYQMWHQGIFGNPTAGTVFDSRPRTSLAKAMMINTAKQWNFVTWSTGQAEPNLSRRKQGWGQPNAQNIFDLRNNMFWVNESQLLQNLQSKEYTVRVAPGSTTPLKITMVYVDPRANPIVQGQHRMNNLNLKVTDPLGDTTYWGNWGLANQLVSNNAINNWFGGVNPPSEGMWSLSGGAADQKNTVENVFVQSPMSGNWKVEVIAAELVQDAWPRPTPSGPVDASFSLVVTGATLASCPGDTNGDNIVNFADLNAVLSNFGLTSGATLAQGDVDGDGDVDFGDLNIVLGAFGTVC